MCLTLTLLAGKDSISDAFWASVSRLISLDALLLLRVVWMTPPAVPWLSPPLCTPATPFCDDAGGGGSFDAWPQMFVAGGPSGDCPSLDRRRERRGAACCASAVSAAAFSGHGSGADDTVQVGTSGFRCGSIDLTSSFSHMESGGQASGDG